MTAFLKIDRCEVCRLEVPWEWVPPVDLCGRLLAGTGVWRSALVDGFCPKCAEAIEGRRKLERRAHTLREQFIREVGGVKPYRKFTFEQYQVTPGNRPAFERAKGFNPSNDNLFVGSLRGRQNASGGGDSSQVFCARWLHRHSHALPADPQAPHENAG
jgi:hypothetical protein